MLIIIVIINSDGFIYHDKGTLFNLEGLNIFFNYFQACCFFSFCFASNDVPLNSTQFQPLFSQSFDMRPICSRKLSTLRLVAFIATACVLFTISRLGHRVLALRGFIWLCRQMLAVKKNKMNRFPSL